MKTTMRAGWQSRPDSMRDKADQMTGMMGGSRMPMQDTSMPVMPGRYKDGGRIINGMDFTGGTNKYSEPKEQNASEMKMKKGGKVCMKKKDGGLASMPEKGMDNGSEMKMKKGGKACMKFAVGGVAKIRHGQSTADGKQKMPTKRV